MTLETVRPGIAVDAELSLIPAQGAAAHEEIMRVGGRRPTSVSLVIPAMNEARNLPWVLERVPDTVKEVLLVDGNSNDGTPEVAQQCRPDIRIVQQRGRGKGAALRTGFAAARSDYIVMMDADGSMEPAEVDLFVAALDEGYDFVKGSRFLPGGGSQDITNLRRWGNRCLVTGVNALFLVPFTDLCYGYIAFRRDLLATLAVASHGFEIETELTLRAVKSRLRIAEVPSMELVRRNGASNLHTFRDGRRIMTTMLRERVVQAPKTVVDVLDLRSMSPRHTHRPELPAPSFARADD